MSRLQGVSDRDASLGAKIAFFFTKRKLAQMAGLETAGMLEPLRMYAHIPRLLSAYGKLEQAESKLDILSPRHRALAELKAATTVRCEYCIDLGSQIARQWGITDEELLALSTSKADYRNAACFSEVDKLILEYATAMSRTPVEVTDRLFDALRAHFDTPSSSASPTSSTWATCVPGSTSRSASGRPASPAIRCAPFPRPIAHDGRRA